jgi:hypothetical protein
VIVRQHLFDIDLAGANLQKASTARYGVDHVVERDLSIVELRQSGSVLQEWPGGFGVGSSNQDVLESSHSERLNQG